MRRSAIVAMTSYQAVERLTMLAIDVVGALPDERLAVGCGQDREREPIGFDEDPGLGGERGGGDRDRLEHS